MYIYFGNQCSLSPPPSLYRIHRALMGAASSSLMGHKAVVLMVLIINYTLLEIFCKRKIYIYVAGTGEEYHGETPEFIWSYSSLFHFVTSSSTGTFYIAFRMQPLTAIYTTHWERGLLSYTLYSNLSSHALWRKHTSYDSVLRALTMTLCGRRVRMHIRVHILWPIRVLPPNTYTATLPLQDLTKSE